MPAQSQQQQKLFGLALAFKRGEVPASEVSDEIKGIADSMTEKEIEDFAATSHSGLPKKLEANLRKLVRDSMKAQSVNESVNEVQVADFEVGDFVHFKRLNKTGMVTLIRGNKITIRTPKRFITGDIKDVEVLYQDGVTPSVTEAGPGLWANIRAKRARGGTPAHKGSKAYKSAVAAGNKINKAESVTEAKAIGKKIFSDAKGKLFFGYQNDDDTVQLVDYKTWKKLSMKDLSNEFFANRVINSILRNERQFNKKVEYNMWSKKTNPSFEDRMDYFIKNNWISNITKIGIKESVNEASVNESSVEIGDIVFFPSANSAATVIDRLGRSVTLKLANGKKIKTIINKIKLMAQDGVLTEETAIYKDWDEFVNPHYIIVYLNNGKKLKIDRRRVKGGNAVYHAILKAFNDNNYKITNKVVNNMMDNLGEGVTEAISRDAAYIHGILQTGQDSAQNFIDDNGLDGAKLSDYVKNNRNNIDGYNVKHYISGERGTVGSSPKLRQAFIKKFKKGNKPKPYSFFNEQKVYIDYLNKKKGFKQDRIKFTSYDTAVKWGKANFDNFNSDMIKFESVNESELKLGVRYVNKQGKEGFIQTGGSTNPKNWFWFDGKIKHPYDKVKKELKPAKDQKKTGFSDYLKQGGRVFDNINPSDSPPINENVSKYTTANISKFAVAIASLTATNPAAVQKFAITHNLNIEKLYQFLKKSKLDAKMDFVTALVGNPGNPIQKKMIKMFQESVNETELPKANVPASVKAKLDMVIDKIKDTKLSYNQKLSVVGKVMDSLGIDKSEFGKMASKLKGTMEGANEHKDCGCGCGGVTEGGCGTSLTEGQLNEWKAEEVLQQLGGRKFIAMTGANNFVKDDKAKSIIFKLPRAKSGIKYVRITLTSMDVYNIEFISVRGSNIKTVATAKGVYNDELQSVFTQYTGLYTSL